MDSKYGRIFTQDDVVNIVFRAFDIDNDNDGFDLDDIIRIIEKDEKLIEQRTFPDDEPLFILRAKDQLAYSAIEQYQIVCDEDGDVDEGHRAGIDEARKRFVEFRNENPDRMKIPD